MISSHNELDDFNFEQLNFAVPRPYLFQLSPDGPHHEPFIV